MEGKKEGRGEENSQLGLSYKGQWRNDQKWGSGEEKTLVGTTFTGALYTVHSCTCIATLYLTHSVCSIPYIRWHFIT